MNYTPERANAIAAEYVLGTLPSRARARVAGLIVVDPRWSEAVRAWEERLLPLAESLSPVAPPARVWTAIQSRIQGRASTEGRRGSVWSNLALWRGLTLAGFATALALALVVLTPPPEAPTETMVAVLAGQDAKPVLVASADRAGRILTVKAISPLQPGADRALELWALLASGNPRSLGLIPATGLARLALPSPAGTALQDIPALAVSLEPAGGSPTGLPTGPVLYSGPLQKLY
jgi:anti-sigma-K factor RskA